MRLNTAICSFVLMFISQASALALEATLHRETGYWDWSDAKVYVDDRAVYALPNNRTTKFWIPESKGLAKVCVQVGQQFSNTVRIPSTLFDKITGSVVIKDEKPLLIFYVRIDRALEHIDLGSELNTLQVDVVFHDKIEEREVRRQRFELNGLESFKAHYSRSVEDWVVVNTKNGIGTTNEGSLGGGLDLKLLSVQGQIKEAVQRTWDEQHTYNRKDTASAGSEISIPTGVVKDGVVVWIDRIRQGTALVKLGSETHRVSIGVVEETFTKIVYDSSEKVPANVKPTSVQSIAVPPSPFVPRSVVRLATRNQQNPFADLENDRKANLSQMNLRPPRSHHQQQIDAIISLVNASSWTRMRYGIQIPLATRNAFGSQTWKLLNGETAHGKVFFVGDRNFTVADSTDKISQIDLNNSTLDSLQLLNKLLTQNIGDANKANHRNSHLITAND